MIMGATEVLIAESGATKTEWRLLRNGELAAEARTTGFNPNVMSPDAIRSELAEAVRSELKDLHPGELVFYGAGIGGESQEKLMKSALAEFWPTAKIDIYHDLAAAARSTLRPSGIVCILGTGSNSCHYENHQVVSRKGGHGYLFGDEGSGMDLGRHLIIGLLQEQFPKSVKRFVESQEGLSIYELKLAILKDAKPNVRMARLAKHLDELLHYDQIKEMIVNRFLAFLDATVCQYVDYQSLDLEVMGSIGWHFQEFFREATSQRNVLMGKFIDNPIDHLVTYHQGLLHNSFSE